LRFNRRWGPHRIGYQLGLNRSTIERVLARYLMPKLACLDQATGLPVRRAKPISYEHGNPGNLVHLDVKKLGRIPNGGGWRTFGHVGRKNEKKSVPTGYSSLHSALDDHSRVGYSEIPNDEKKETAAVFWVRAKKFFAEAGITVTVVMTDNGSC
jgi:hypothetical protein